jgi:hypothetical protein
MASAGAAGLLTRASDRGLTSRGVSRAVAAAGAVAALLFLRAVILDGLLLWCEPILETVAFGQINLLVLVLVLADVLPRHPGNQSLRGLIARAWGSGTGEQLLWFASAVLVRSSACGWPPDSLAAGRSWLPRWCAG